MASRACARLVASRRRTSSASSLRRTGGVAVAPAAQRVERALVAFDALDDLDDLVALRAVFLAPLLLAPLVLALLFVAPAFLAVAFLAVEARPPDFLATLVALRADAFLVVALRVPRAAETSAIRRSRRSTSLLVARPRLAICWRISARTASMRRSLLRRLRSTSSSMTDCACSAWTSPARTRSRMRSSARACVIAVKVMPASSKRFSRSFSAMVERYDRTCPGARSGRGNADSDPLAPGTVRGGAAPV